MVTRQCTAGPKVCDLAPTIGADENVSAFEVTVTDLHYFVEVLQARSHIPDVGSGDGLLHFSKALDDGAQSPTRDVLHHNLHRSVGNWGRGGGLPRGRGMICASLRWWGFSSADANVGDNVGVAAALHEANLVDQGLYSRLAPITARTQRDGYLLDRHKLALLLVKAEVDCPSRPATQDVVSPDHDVELL